ncbi:calcium-binding protein [Nonomuraea turkmeniaca]|uniref:Calcium-binding protein n=1 Tax=Nonomuraea turkmeniaca TaxID=103838 RepID=A0A5S4FJF2_9ACTN|nr:calcium-binding protein [Nonomuraea turkmeniaca]
MIHCKTIDGVARLRIRLVMLRLLIVTEGYEATTAQHHTYVANHSKAAGSAGSGRLPRSIAAAGLVSVLTTAMIACSGMAAARVQPPTCFGVPATIIAAPNTPTSGTPGPDVIVGTAGADVIDGQLGNDLICGMAGDDILAGGLGNDQLDGGIGDDGVHGDMFRSAGNASGSGNDRLVGGDGNDLMNGDSYAPNGTATGGGNDGLYGGDGNDLMTGDSRGRSASGGGRDRLDGGADSGTGDEHLVGDSGSTVGDAAGAGDDIILGGPGLELLIGDSNAAQNASGNGGDDLLDVGADGGFAAIGDHNINDPAGGRAIGSGNDRIIGGSADDFLVGDSAVVDATVTSAGRDVISGRAGNDSLFGDNTDFNVTMTVGTAGGNDLLDGGDGIDTLRAGPHNDYLDGGPDAPDDCDGEAGVDIAARCEIVSNVP